MVRRAQHDAGPTTRQLRHQAVRVAQPAPAAQKHPYYYRDGQKGVLGESNEDNRLAPKELVVGVSLDGDTKAYPLEALRSQPTVNDSLGGNEVLVFLETNTETALVYDRRVDGEAMSFRLLPGGGARPLLMDDETGSTWMALTGLAIDGPLKGAALERVASHLSFWFAWNDWNPTTELYQPPGA